METIKRLNSIGRSVKLVNRFEYQMYCSKKHRWPTISLSHERNILAVITKLEHTSLPGYNFNKFVCFIFTINAKKPCSNKY